ncbi:MAG: alpha-galactosidase [Fidelibacterota bacterium]|nr:MAG: alpha-galactosidase [Candidatus Neomarinimicrobiota bacterium]
MKEKSLLTDIATIDTPEPEVRFTSDRTIYVETLVSGRWAGRYWNASGRINFPYQRWTEDAFQLEVDQELLSTGWQWVSATEAPKTERGCRHFVAELSNTTHSVGVRMHTLLDGTPVLTRWLEITNKSDKPVALTAVSPWSGRLWPRTDARLSPPKGFDHAFSLGYFTRFDQGYEGWFDWKPMPGGATVVKCDKGQGFDDPFFIVRSEARGEYFICHLAWSANWDIQFDCEQEPSSTGLLFKIGPSSVSPQRVIMPDETIHTPAVHLGHVEGDLDTTVQAMHEHIRRSVLPPRPPERSYLIQYSATGDQNYLATHRGDLAGGTEESIIENIDLAAAVGAEVFILDAGWWDVPGDWIPAPERYPRGLEPLVEYAHKKGLLFGLYVEIERTLSWNTGELGLSSKVATEHPDWIMPKGILNLTKPEVANYVESELCRIIDQYSLDLYRLDYNPIFTGEGPSTPRDGFMENNYWRYYEVFYAIFEHIQKKYPDLILQQAAAGGARNDLGTVGRFHEAYLTDGLDMPRVLQVYSGQTLALPPEILVIGLGEGSDLGLGDGHLDTHLRSTFALSTPWLLLGVSPSVAELTPQRRGRYLHYANIYKEFIRPLLPTCKMYHHSPVTSRRGVESSGWFVMEYASPDGDKGWAVILRMGETESDSFIFMPRGLDPGRTYRVTFDNTGGTATIQGWRLIYEGLPIRREAVMSSELLLFEAQ